MSDTSDIRASLEKVGQLLVERRAISARALVRALKRAKSDRSGESEERFLEGLITAGDAIEGTIVAFLAERSGSPGIDLS